MQTGFVIAVLKTYLQTCIQKYPPCSTYHAKYLLDLLFKKDAAAVDYLRKHSDDSVLAPYCDEEVLECIEEDYCLSLRSLA